MTVVTPGTSSDCTILSIKRGIVPRAVLKEECKEYEMSSDIPQSLIAVTIGFILGWYLPDIYHWGKEWLLKR